MYETHWGLRRSAFRNVLDPRAYFAGGPQEEAIARLQFLVDQNWRLGLLSGEAGTGKSLLLQVLASTLRHRGMTVAQISLRGLDPEEFLWRLAAGIGLNPELAESPFALWRHIDDQFSAFRYQLKPLVILFDSFEAVTPGVAALVSRVAHTDDLPGLRLSVIISGRPYQRPNPGRELLQFTDLRIDLVAWNQQETEEFVVHALEQVGATRPIFSQPALARLYDLSQGLPRRVNQLAELALLAGAGQELEIIDAETVEGVFLELSVADVAA
jgi:type II secretory pathway predicted ATPase ExeA